MHQNVVAKQFVSVTTSGVIATSSGVNTAADARRRDQVMRGRSETFGFSNRKMWIRRTASGSKRQRRLRKEDLLLEDDTDWNTGSIQPF